MNRAIVAGTGYFVLVFIAGFALGTLRTFIVQPAVGELTAVLIELPVMLAIAWVACLRLVRFAALPDNAPSRIAMGVWALLLLLIAEFATGTLLIGRSAAEQINEYRRLPVLIGFAAQLAYAAFPLLTAKRAHQKREG